MKINVDGRIANLACALQCLPCGMPAPVLPAPVCTAKKNMQFGPRAHSDFLKLGFTPTMRMARGTKLELGWG